MYDYSRRAGMADYPADIALTGQPAVLGKVMGLLGFACLFTEAGIALDERRIVRGEAGPRAEGARISRDILQAYYSLDLSITNAHPGKRRVSTEHIEIYVLTSA